MNLINLVLRERSQIQKAAYTVIFHVHKNLKYVKLIQDVGSQNSQFLLKKREGNMRGASEKMVTYFVTQAVTRVCSLTGYTMMVCALFGAYAICIYTKKLFKTES